MANIKIEDVHKLLDLVHQVSIKTNHYACLDYSNDNHARNILVIIQKYGRVAGKKFDLCETFSIYPDHECDETDCKAYEHCRDYLKGLLEEVM